MNVAMSAESNEWIHKSGNANAAAQFPTAVKPRVVYNTRVMLPSAKKIAFLPLKKVMLFMNFRAHVKLGT